MKNKLILAFLLTMLVGCAVMVTGCEWIRDSLGLDEQNKIIPPVDGITMTASAGVGGSISVSPSGRKLVPNEVVSITLTGDTGYDPDSLVINGVDIVMTGNVYSLKVSGEVKHYDIKGLFKKNKQGILMQSDWETTNRYRRYVGDTEWKETPTDIYIYKFGEDNMYRKYEGPNWIGEGSYSFKGDTLRLGGIIARVTIFDGKILDYYSVSKYYQINPNDPIFPDSEVRYVYKAVAKN
jgi:hypothetical protein